MAKIGIYGGSFNPPHAGHISAAKQALDALKLDRLLLIPVASAPHKSMPHLTASGQDRMAMLELSAQGAPGLEPCDVELQREGVSYTVDTLRILKEQYPNDTLVLLMGTDMFLIFENWRSAEEICRMAELAVLYRGEKGEKEQIDAQKQRLEERFDAKITLVKNEALEISSTEVRRLLTFQCAGDYLLPGVESYIWEKGLYGTERDLRNLPMEELEQIVVSLLHPNRVAHVLGCRDTAVALARHYGADETDAARAGILHDITKVLPPAQQLLLCQTYGVELDAFSRENAKTLHALTGSLVAKRIFGENEAVCSAICHHTTGCANMTLLEKIIYIADYMEPNRDFPEVEALREVTWRDLDSAVLMGLEMTLAILQANHRAVAPDSLAAIADLKQKLGGESRLPG